MPKLSQAAVDYTDSGSKEEHCAIWQYYVNRTTCELVMGPIASGGWCKRFRADKHRQLMKLLRRVVAVQARLHQANLRKVYTPAQLKDVHGPWHAGPVPTAAGEPSNTGSEGDHSRLGQIGGRTTRHPRASLEAEYEDQQPSPRRDLRYEMSNRRRKSTGQRQMASDVAKAKDPLGHGSNPRGSTRKIAARVRNIMGHLDRAWVDARLAPELSVGTAPAHMDTARGLLESKGYKVLGRHGEHGTVGYDSWNVREPEDVAKAKDALGHGSDPKGVHCTTGAQPALRFPTIAYRKDSACRKYRTKDQSISQWTNDELKADTPYNDLTDPTITTFNRITEGHAETIAAHGLQRGRGKDYRGPEAGFGRKHDRIDNLRRKTPEYGRRKLEQPPSKTR
jgi:hypothetical protein